ncbi:hypothetical protein BZG36_01952 [Bifiguratus adelaidae]|uniref:Arrestin C-terminal-like domain-containing protein n=1 Tax=Bifiguratus adelaidae TaxID=1938954 RepID=A0A261Y3W9_9FUNG|nr:hypothetical protein BZG36_01952 [Bifiguratus adelaidae]
MSPGSVRPNSLSSHISTGSGSVVPCSPPLPESRLPGYFQPSANHHAHAQVRSFRDSSVDDSSGAVNTPLTDTLSTSSSNTSQNESKISTRWPRAVRNSVSSKPKPIRIKHHPDIDISMSLNASSVPSGGLLEGNLIVQVQPDAKVTVSGFAIDLFGVEEITNSTLKPTYAKTPQTQILRFFHMKTDLQPLHLVKEQKYNHTNVDINEDQDGTLGYMSPPLPSSSHQGSVDVIEPVPDKVLWVPTKARSVLPFAFWIPPDVGGSYWCRKGGVKFELVGSIALEPAKRSPPYLLITRLETHIQHPHGEFLAIMSPLNDASAPVMDQTEGTVFLGGKGLVYGWAGVKKQWWMAGSAIRVKVGVRNKTRKKVNAIKLSLKRRIKTFEFVHPPDEFDQEIGYVEATSLPLKNMTSDSTMQISETQLKNQGWWNGIESNNEGEVELELIVPPNAVSITNRHLLQVTYEILVSINVGFSNYLTLTLPVTITPASVFDVEFSHQSQASILGPQSEVESVNSPTSPATTIWSTGSPYVGQLRSPWMPRYQPTPTPKTTCIHLSERHVPTSPYHARTDDRRSNARFNDSEIEQRRQAVTAQWIGSLENFHPDVMPSSPLRECLSAPPDSDSSHFPVSASCSCSCSSLDTQSIGPSTSVDEMIRPSVEYLQPSPSKDPSFHFDCPECIASHERLTYPEAPGIRTMASTVPAETREWALTSRRTKSWHPQEKRSMTSPSSTSRSHRTTRLRRSTGVSKAAKLKRFVAPRSRASSDSLFRGKSAKWVDVMDDMQAMAAAINDPDVRLHREAVKIVPILFVMNNQAPQSMSAVIQDNTNHEQQEMDLAEALEQNAAIARANARKKSDSSTVTEGSASTVNKPNAIDNSDAVITTVLRPKPTIQTSNLGSVEDVRVSAYTSAPTTPNCVVRKLKGIASPVGKGGSIPNIEMGPNGRLPRMDQALGVQPDLSKHCTTPFPSASSITTTDTTQDDDCSYCTAVPFQEDESIPGYLDAVVECAEPARSLQSSNVKPFYSTSTLAQYGATTDRDSDHASISDFEELKTLHGRLGLINNGK